MRVLRLPAIHHDTNLVVIEGSIGNLLIDAGTSWYQGLQVERIKGVLGEKANLDRILLTSKRYPCSGGAKHLSESFANCEVGIHADGQAAEAGAQGQRRELQGTADEAATSPAGCRQGAAA